MRLSIGLLRRKVKTLNKEALLRLREMLTDPAILNLIAEPTKVMTQGLSDTCQNYRKNLEKSPGPEEYKQRLESQNITLELNTLNEIEQTARNNIQALLSEIDLLLKKDIRYHF
jgi:hypothetical protein